jgi:hypothetical protein
VVQGCRFLTNFIHEAGAVRYDLCRLGGLECIVSAMLAFPEQEDVQRAASAAFLNVTSDVSPLHLNMVVEAGAIPPLVRAVKDHPDAVQLHNFACRVLARLSQIPEHRAMLLESGCLSALALSYERHAEQHENVRNICQQAMQAFFV